MFVRTLRDPFLILIAACMVFFVNLGAYPLFDEDEPKNAVCGREMFLRGDWVVPTFNQELRTDKPILIYWLMSAAYSVFGVNEFAARFGSSCLAVGTCLLTYFLGRRLFDPATGFLAAIILASSLMFSAVGRAVTPDSILIFCITLAFSAYVWAVSNKTPGSFATNWQPDNWRSLLPATRWLGLPFYAAMGLAVLAKGPVGVILPSVMIGLFLLTLRQAQANVTQEQPPLEGAWWRKAIFSILRTLHPARILQVAWGVRPVTGLLLTCAIALPWYIVVGIQTDGAWLQGFLGGHNLGRFLEPMENHRGPIFYYIPVVFAGFFPWSVFGWQTIRYGRTTLKTDQADWPSLAFLTVWIGVWVGFFSLASTKLPNYVLPIYPALALGTARYLVIWARRADGRESGSFRNSCRLLAALGCLMAIGLTVTASILLPGDLWLGALGLFPLTGGAIAYGCACRQERGRAVAALAVCGLLLTVSAMGFASVAVAKHQNASYFAAALEKAGAPPDARLGTWQMSLPSLVFYADDRVEPLRQPTDVRAFLAAEPGSYVITRADKLEELTKDLPPGVEILARQKRFLRRHDLVLLGTSPSGISQATHEELR